MNSDATQKKAHLTHHSTAGGCAAKLPSLSLHEILSGIATRRDPRLLVGFSGSDDAAVFQLSEHLALVETVDFIPPIVDDPFTFGQIAAANSLSDVFAMGGEPLTALNICCFPDEGISTDSLKAIIEGGLSKVTEASAFLVGGHTVRDRELKYGLAVTGTIDPKNIKANHMARAGDSIVLTKPIGTGVLTSARRKGVGAESLLEPAIRSMTTLNAPAARLMVAMGAHAATDITGFGLLVHLLEVAKASRLSMEISFSEIPFFPSARELSAEGIKTGNTLFNEQAAFGSTEFAEPLPRGDELLLYDPQTSGGLAVFLPEERAGEFVRQLKDAGVDARVIGSTREGPTKIRVVA